MTTRAGRVFKTLHDRIELLEASNDDLLGACKLATDYLKNGLPNIAQDRLEKAISKAEGRE